MDWPEYTTMDWLEDITITHTNTGSAVSPLIGKRTPVYEE
jgi:hypothetical protein